jgi:hypothetical protein
MIQNKNFPEFESQDKKVSVGIPDGNKKPAIRFFDKLKLFFKEKVANNPTVQKILDKIGIAREDEDMMDTLAIIRKNRSRLDKINMALTICLITVIVIAWRVIPGMLNNVDQMENDIKEQEQVIKMEEQNNMFLEKLQQDRNALVEKIHKVYSAVPDADEKAEEMIAMLEDIAAKNRMVIDAIGIRKVPESQFYYDDLLGVVDVYEYTFSVESSLPHILSFIGSLRSSLRLMDVMTMEIEEGKGTYKANFSLFAYNLINKDSEA